MLIIKITKEKINITFDALIPQKLKEEY